MKRWRRSLQAPRPSLGNTKLGSANHGGLEHSSIPKLSRGSSRAPTSPCAKNQLAGREHFRAEVREPNRPLAAERPVAVGCGGNVRRARTRDLDQASGPDRGTPARPKVV